MNLPVDLPVTMTERWLEALGCGTILVGESGRILYANERFCDIAGQSGSMLAGNRIEALCQSETDGEVVIARLTRDHETNQAEFHIVRPDGRRVPVIVSGKLLGEGDGQAKYVLITVVDISRQKKAEERLKEHNKVVSELSDTILTQALDLKHHSEHLEKKVRQRTSELEEANMEAIYMLAVASEAKDGDTGAHVLRIRSYTEAIARALGLPASVTLRYGYSAILHDVGKMIVPDDILKKPGRLSPEERARMQEHAAAGERILSKKPFFDVARQIARSHHENWDGSGYPDGRNGSAIPQAARIVRVADVYDALVSTRVYKPAWNPADALAEIRAGSGKQFDPEPVEAFRELFSSGKLK